MNGVRQNPEPHETLLQAALQEYLERVDNGETVDREEFLARHPHIADELRSFINTSEGIQQMIRMHTDQRGPEDAADVTTHSFAHHSEETIPPRWGDRENQPDELGKQFGRYRILGTLGRGAMGTVHLAEDTQLLRRVALKTPHFDKADGDEILQRFYREARVAATLRHPNICPVYDVGEIDGRHYISMAYIEGRMLSSYIVPGKPQSERNIGIIARKIARALQQAHDHGIVHRDLKPGNVMIDGRGEPIIMDFGLAHQTTSDSQLRLTRSGMLVGSPAYMSPEQVEGDLTKLGPATDQYSLGVMLYEMLTGQLPFQGTLAAVLGQIVVKQPKPPGELRPGLDPRLEAVCLRMMDKSPTRRFASLTAVADELTAILRIPPEAASPASGSTPTSPSAKAPIDDRPSKVPPTVKPETAPSAEITQSKLESLALLARKLLAKHDYEQVVQMLEQVPEDRRNNEIRALLDRARSLFDEVAFLLTEIDEAVRLRDGGTALRKVERLLELKPGNQRALQVQEQIRRRRTSTKPRDSRGLTIFGRPVGEGSWFPWLAAAVGLIAFTGMYAAVVMYLRVGDAVVKVSINDPEIKVGLQGRTLTIESSKDPVKVDAGEGNSLTIRYGDLEFTTDRFTLNKGDNPAVVIELLDDKLSARFGDVLLGEKPVPKRATPPDSVAANSTNRVMPGKAVPSTRPGPADKEPNTEISRTQSSEHNYEFVEVARLSGARGAIWQVAFLPDGKNAISGGFDAAVRMWSIPEGKEIRQFREIPLVTCIAVSRDGHQIAAGNSQGEIRVWNSDTAEIIREISQPKHVIADVDFSPDGKQLLFSGHGLQPTIWDLENNREAAHFETGDNWVLSAGFLPDGKQAACGTANGKLIVWDIASGEKRQTFDQHPSWIRQLSFSKDGQRIACCASTIAKDSANRIWNVATGSEVLRLEGHTDGTPSIAFTPDNRYVVTGSFDKTFRLWDASNGAELARKECETHVAHALAISPDGQYVLSGGGVYAMPDKQDIDDKDYALRLWRIKESGTSDLTMRIPKGNADMSDDRSIAKWVLSVDGRLRVELRDGRIVAVDRPGDIPNEPFRVDFVFLGFGSKYVPADVKRLAGLSGLRDVQLERYAGWDDDVFLPFRGMTRLELFKLRGESRLTGTGLETLVGCTALNTLELNVCQLTDAACETISRMPALRQLGFNSPHVTARGFEALSKMKNLEALILSGMKLSAEAAGYIKRVKNLRHLHCDGVTDEAMSHIGEMTNLVELWLFRANVTDEGLKSTANLRKLTSLVVQDAPIQGSGLEPLRMLPLLNQVDLAGTDIDDSALQMIAQMPRLKFLTVSKSRITDTGVSHLTNLREILQLNLSGTRVSDASVPQLEKLKSLKNFDLTETLVTQAGLVRLRAALPDCAIVPASATSAPPKETPQPALKPDDGWVSLFNGRDLAGWKSIGGQGGAIVQNGVLVLTADVGPAWVGTDREFSDFELEFEYRLQPGGNSGVFLRAFDDGDPSGAGFLEVQLLDDTAKQYRNVQNWQKNGAVYGIIPPSAQSNAPPSQWNSMSVKAVGPRIAVVVNGKEIIDGNLHGFEIQKNVHPDIDRRSGRIGLQRHGSQVEFRNIRIRRLDEQTLTNTSTAELELKAQKAVLRNRWVKLDDKTPQNSAWKWGEPLKNPEFKSWKNDVLSLDNGAIAYNSIQARDVSFRARVKLIEGQNMALVVRSKHGEGGIYSYIDKRANGKLHIAVLDSKDETVLNIKDDFFKFCVTAVGNQVTIEVNGETVIKHQTQNMRVGHVETTCYRARGMFKDIEAKILDK